MISTICLNPAYDQTIEVSDLELGGLNRILSGRKDMGGKGINVAIVAHRLGLEVQCLGAMGEENSKDIETMLKKEGILIDFMRIPGRVRTNLKIVSQKNYTVTELNEPGSAITKAQIAEFIDMAVNKTKGNNYVVVTGSLPPGCPENTYELLIKALGDTPCMLDAVGELLLNGLKASPFLIKPNLSELESTMGKQLSTLRGIREAAYGLIERGAQNVIVSMGRVGALLTNGSQTYFSPGLDVDARSTVGAGDAMLGGMLYGLLKGEKLHDAFRYGMAAGAASVITEGTQLINKNDFENLLPSVQIQVV